MTTAPLSKALIASQPLPDIAGAGGVPEWVHLLPAGEVTTLDGRGPYKSINAADLIAASFASGRKLVIDENHSTDLRAPLGEPAPAYGEIVEMQSRDDGIWGRVDWNEAGKALLSAKAYAGISPVIFHDKNNRIGRIGRASLVNVPNLNGLKALHSAKEETDMSFSKRLAKLLGKDADASEDDIYTAIETHMAAAPEKALQSAQTALSDVGKVLGVEGGDAGAILQAAKTASGDARTLVPALQAQVTTLKGAVDQMKADRRTEKAEAFIEGEEAKFNTGINASNREEFIAMHMENPERTEKLVGGFMYLNERGKPAPIQEAKSLHMATPADVTAKAKKYKARMESEGTMMTLTEAILAVSEGKE